jgi:MtN3 and saliva related transmembrane protein
MPSRLIDIVGLAGATLTTLCWLPQALKIMRDKDTRALSLIATVALTIGVALWLVYGLALGDWPLIGANGVTLALILPILAMKLRYGCAAAPVVSTPILTCVESGLWTRSCLRKAVTGR